MRRIVSLLAASLVAAAITAPAAWARPGGVVPAGSSAFGGSALSWQQAWIGWTFGGSTNPLLNEDVCGEVVDGVFLLAGAIDEGLERSCTVPAGVPLLAAPSGTVVWWGIDGESEEELLGALDHFVSFLGAPRVVLDGRSLSVRGSYARSGVYPIDVEDGNFMESVGLPVVENPLRVASAGWFVRIRPLTPGEHVLEIGDAWSSMTFNLTVGPGR